MAVTKLRSLRCLYMNNNRLTKLHPRYRKIQCYPYYLQHVRSFAKSNHSGVDVGWKLALNFIFSLKEMVSLGYIWLRGNKLQSLPVELCTVRRVFKMAEIRLSSSLFQLYWLRVPSYGHHFENFFLRNIKVIHLEFNEIEFISDSIGALLNLKQLYPTGFRIIENVTLYTLVHTGHFIDCYSSIWKKRMKP